jgi:hypothetical protein
MELDEAEYLIEIKKRQRSTTCRNKGLGKDINN